MNSKLKTIANGVRRIDSVFYRTVTDLELVKECIRRWYQGFYDRDPTEAEMTEALLRADGDVVVVFGVAYPSVRAACIANGASPASAHKRINKYSETAEEAIVALLTKVIVFGIAYDNETEACRANGVVHRSVKNRMERLGETLEEAITNRMTRGVTRKRTVVFGVEYESFNAACHAHEIHPQTVRSRLDEPGVDLDTLMTELIASKLDDRSVTVFGVRYSGLDAACDANDVWKSSVVRRITRSDETVEQAIKALHSSGRTLKKPTTAFGIEYESITAACRAHEVSVRSVGNRMERLGETIEKAITHLKTNKYKKAA